MSSKEEFDAFLLFMERQTQKEPSFWDKFKNWLFKKGAPDA